MLREKVYRWARGMILVLSFGLILGGASVAGAKKVMTLNIWDWHRPRGDLLEEFIPVYEKENPGIKLEQVIFGSGDLYWNKTLVAISAGNVPELHTFHPDRLGLVRDHLEAFPQDLFPIEKFREEYSASRERYEWEEGKIYALPYGIMVATLWYNNQLFGEAGLSEGDYPNTWEDLRTVAKKLTKYSADGEIEMAGFAFNNRWDAMFSDFNYQMGGYLYSADGTKSAVNTPEGLTVVKFLRDLVYKDRVNSPDYLGFDDAFGTGMTPMTYCWTWFGGWLDSTHPEIDYGISVPPTPSGKDLPARGRCNPEYHLSVLRGVPDEKKVEAFKFIKWLAENDEYGIAIAKMSGVIPARTALWTHPDITSDPVIATIVKQAPYSIFTGEMVQAMYSEIKQIEERIYSGMSPEEALEMTEKRVNDILKERPPTWISERPR